MPVKTAATLADALTVWRRPVDRPDELIDGQPAEATSTLKPHERRLKHLEAGGLCRGAGCLRGPTTGHQLIPHHVVGFSHCHTTSYSDTTLLCTSEHHDIHTGKKTIRLKDGR